MPRLGKQARHLTSARANAKKPKPTIGSADPALDEAQPMATDEPAATPPTATGTPSIGEQARHLSSARPNAKKPKPTDGAQSVRP